jgi:hypothetical protein
VAGRQAVSIWPTDIRKGKLNFPVFVKLGSQTTHEVRIRTMWWKRRRDRGRTAAPAFSIRDDAPRRAYAGPFRRPGNS